MSRKDHIAVISDGLSIIRTSEFSFHIFNRFYDFASEETLHNDWSSSIILVSDEPDFLANDLDERIGQHNNILIIILYNQAIYLKIYIYYYRYFITETLDLVLYF